MYDKRAASPASHGRPVPSFTSAKALVAKRAEHNAGASMRTCLTSMCVKFVMAKRMKKRPLSASRAKNGFVALMTTRSLCP